MFSTPNHISISTRIFDFTIFFRYTGFWWCPVRDTSDNSHYILFEQVDESEVAEYKITSYDGKNFSTFLVSRNFSLHSLPISLGTTETHRFPKTGETNAKSALKLIKVRTSNVVGDVTSSILDLNFDLHEYFPWYEYLVRAGWTPDGQR